MTFKTYDTFFYTKKPVYCERCGAVLEEKLLQDGYDVITGAEKLTTFLVCPKTKLSIYEHDAWLVHGNGDAWSNLRKAYKA